MTHSESANVDWDELAACGIAGVLDPRDRVGAKNHLIDRAHKSALARYGGNFAGASVLDFGCGVGRISEWLVARGADVHGIDPSPQMVAAAGSRVPGARFDVLTDDELPGKAPYDVVLAVYVLSTVPETRLRTTILNLASVLKPEGRLVCLEKVSDGIPPRGWTHEQYRRDFADAGLEIRTSEIVRLGQSGVLRRASRRFVANLPLLPYLLRLEARRDARETFTGGQYADYILVAHPFRDANRP